MRRLLVIIIILAGMLGGAVSTAAAAARVASITIQGLRYTSEARVRGLFPCQVGDPYTPSCVSITEQYLRDWKIFDQIHFKTLPASDGMHITLTLHEALLVGAVDLTGNYPLLEQSLRKRLSLRPGNTYSEEQAKLQVTRLRDIFQKVGYDDTTAEWKSTFDPEKGDMVVRYKVKKGLRIRLGDVMVTGNTVFPAGRFISAFHPYRTFTPAIKRSGLRQLLDLYHRHGYVRARVKITEQNLNPNGRMDLTVTVTEGPRLKIKFVGNRYLDGGKLRHVLTFEQDASFDDVAIEDSVTALHKLYASRGFADAKVTANKIETSPNHYEIIFMVDEGLRHVVDKIQIDGNAPISRKRVREQMLTKTLSFSRRGGLDYSLLPIDQQLISNYYKSLGFINVSVAPLEVVSLLLPVRKEVKVDLNPGLQILVGGVSFDGIDGIPQKDLLDVLVNYPQRPYNPFALEADRESILAYMKNNGRPYATVSQATTPHFDTNEMTVHYSVGQDRLVRIGEVLFVGNTLTSSKAVLHAMSIHTGEPYSYRKMLDSELGLRRLGVFQNVTIEPMGLKEKYDVVHLVVRMEELRPFVLDVSAGASTDDLYTGSLSFTNFNSFGWAKRLGLRLIGGQRMSRAEVTWMDPRFLGYDLSWGLNSLIQYERRPSFDYVQASSGTGFFRRFHRTSFMTRYQVDKNYFLSGDKAQANLSGVRDNTLSKISFSATYDRRNSFSDPTTGFYLMGGLDILNEIRGEQANFVKFRTGLGKYNHFWSRLIVTNDLRFERVETIGSNVSVPGNERFFLGGDTTIRGFSLDSIGTKDTLGNALGANMRWIHNVELHLVVSQSFQFAVWHDMGSLTDTFHEITLQTFKQSVGPGLRFMTPVGPLKLDYGFVLMRQPGDPFGRFHFSFGNVF